MSHGGESINVEESISQESLDFLNELNDTLAKVQIAIDVYKQWLAKFYRLKEGDRVLPGGKIERSE